MSANQFAADTTVDEVIHTNPALSRVFAAHRIDTCCGGGATLAEAAGSRGIALDALLQALNRPEPPRAVAVVAPAAAPAHAGAEPGRLAPFFITSLIFALTFGATLGVLVLASITQPWSFLRGVPLGAAKTAHGYAQVFGFAALFIMGVAYHTMPRFKSTTLATPRLAWASFWLQTGGVLLVGFGMLIGPPVSGPAWLLGTVALFAAALAFGWTAYGTLSATAPLPEGVEPYLLAGCVWLVVATILAIAAAAGVGVALQPAVWAAAVWGFIGSWIFGMSLRVLPVFMGLPPARRRPGLFALYQGAVLLWVVNAIVEAWTLEPVLRGLGGAALAFGTATFVLRLGIFGPREDPGGAVDRGYEKFIVTGYAWLVVGVVFEPGWTAGAAIAGSPPPSLLLDLGRHAFTLGFLTQMIIGVATRIVPVFTGSRLWSPRWREATYYLLNAAVVARALQAVVELGNVGEAWPYVALSGPFGLAAFMVFAANLFRTMRVRPQAAAAAATVVRVAAAAGEQ